MLTTSLSRISFSEKSLINNLFRNQKFSLSWQKSLRQLFGCMTMTSKTSPLTQKPYFLLQIQHLNWPHLIPSSTISLVKLSTRTWFKPTPTKCSWKPSHKPNINHKIKPKSPRFKFTSRLSFCNKPKPVIVTLLISVLSPTFLLSAWSSWRFAARRKCTFVTTWITWLLIMSPSSTESPKFLTPTNSSSSWLKCSSTIKITELVLSLWRKSSAKWL